MLKSLFLRAFCKKRDFSMDYGAPGSFRSSGLVGKAFSIQQNTCSGNLFPEVGSGVPGCLGYGGVLKTAFLHFRCNFLDFSTFAARRRRNIARKPESPKARKGERGPMRRRHRRRLRDGDGAASYCRAKRRRFALRHVRPPPACPRWMCPRRMPPPAASPSSLSRYPWPSPIAHLLDIRPTRLRILAPLVVSSRPLSFSTRPFAILRCFSS